MQDERIPKLLFTYHPKENKIIQIPRKPEQAEVPNPGVAVDNDNIFNIFLIFSLILKIMPIQVKLNVYTNLNNIT